MADPFGLSFSPGAQNGPNGQPLNGSKPSPIQQAIQTLSLKIPRSPGASAFTATPLLTSPGGSGFGNPNSVAALEQLRRMLFGGADQNGTGVTGSQPVGGPDLAQIFSQIFGQSQRQDYSPQSGSGAPMGGESGSGAPLPEPSSGVPLPRFDAGKDRKDLQLTPGPLDTGTEPMQDRNDTQYI